MELLIPKGYKLIASSELPGTGNVIASAYYNEEVERIYFTLSDPITGDKFAFGPVQKRVLTTLQNVLNDVVAMKDVRYLE